MNRNEVEKIICGVRDLAAKKGINASFVMHKEISHLMRIGNNSVSLNTSESLVRLDIEVFKGKKSGKHTQMGEISGSEYVEKALEIAVIKADNSAENAFEMPIPEVHKSIRHSEQYDEALESVDPQFKADAYKEIIEKVGNKYNFSGAWSSGSVELFITTTKNQNTAWHLGTDMQFNLVLKHPQKKWELKETQTGWQLKEFSTIRAIENLNRLLSVYENNEGIKLEPGNYKVAFGADAIAEIMAMAAETGFNGRAYEEKQGWTTNAKLGDQILSEKITVADLPNNNNTFGYVFDLTGHERKPFVFVENGKLINFAYDAVTAAKFDKTATGHTTETLSLAVAGGKDSDCAIDASKEYGRVIYVPALHYMGLPNPGKGVFTGSSRFNGLLIENGKIIGPVFSARITDTFKNVFSNILRISENVQSANISHTYDRRAPIALSVPTLIIADNVKITDSADSF